MRTLTERMRISHEKLLEDAEHDAIPLADQTRPYAVLLVEADRLRQEFQYTFDVLRQHVT